MHDAKILNLLLIEDSEQDAALILRLFAKAGQRVESERVWDESSLRSALETKIWDAILCDYNLPGFDAFRALAIVRATKLDLPFIIVSGAIGEETAVAAMRGGAHDYILKSNLQRLLPAVERELREAEVRRSKRRTEESLRKAQAALEASEAKYRRLVEASTLGVIVSGIDGSLHEVNDAYLAMIGYTREDFERGLRWDELTPPEYQTTDQEHIAEMLARGACSHYEKEYFRKDGSRVPVLIGYALLSSHEPVSCICFVADLTEQKRIESELQKALQSRDQFLSISSHELKTPLTSLSLQLQLLQRQIQKAQANPLPANHLARTVGVAGRQIQRLNSLVDDLLDVSRISNGKLSIRPENFKVSEMIHEVVTRLAEQAVQAGCTLSVDVPSEMTVCWDLHRVDQVLANLLSNAFKYAPGTPVQIRLVSSNDSVELTVRDQGPGIKPEEQPRVFDRFERVTNKTGAPGLGLGLYIVREIVQLHGGEITLQSAPGEGCCFTVRMPLTAAGAPLRSTALPDLLNELDLPKEA